MATSRTEKSDVDAHAAKRNAEDGARVWSWHERVRFLGGAIKERRRRRLLLDLQFLFASRRPVVSHRDSHLLERLTPSVDPCRQRSPTVRPFSSALPVRITKATRVNDTKVETRFSFSALRRGGPFLDDSASRLSRALPRQNDKAFSRRLVLPNRRWNCVGILLL